MSWVKGSTQGGELRFGGDENLDDVRSLVYRQMRDWDPGREGEYLNFADVEICRVKESGRELGMGYLKVRYGPSIFPFGEISDGGGKFTKVSVNSDVVLVYGQWDLGEPSRYDVYFRCQIPDAPAEQKNGVPVVGEMVDTLTGETGARTRMKHLLHSAQVMARTLDCENDPAIPSEPPASVK
ncbi:MULTISPECIES: hypothetical protein [Streptomyces]|uniref:hypothetical protein n=1 Tax=Streptomyces TaxID=1883 RepID=UPI00114D2916|nr:MULTISPECIES: hypothetical protein [Streptomyces]